MPSKSTHQTVSAIGETALIERIRELCADDASGSKVVGIGGTGGIGDDCAVLPLPVINTPSSRTLITTDTMVEGVHFRRDFSSAHDVGSKLLAISLSDIAAMGGIANGALISLELPSDTSVAWIEDLYGGIVELARSHTVQIVGGNCTSSTVLSLTSTVIGVSIAAPILRSGARVGDDLWVSGPLGVAQCGLEVLLGHLPEAAFSDKELLRVLERYHRPRPRLELGRKLSELSTVTSMLDLSDGILLDAEHLARESDIVVELNPESFPGRDLARASYRISWGRLLAGGGDYELLFTAPPSARNAIAALVTEESLGKTIHPQVVGKILDKKSFTEKVVILRTDGASISRREFLNDEGVTQLSPGFEHFSSQRKI